MKNFLWGVLGLLLSVYLLWSGYQITQYYSRYTFGDYIVTAVFIGVIVKIILLCAKKIPEIRKSKRVMGGLIFFSLFVLIGVAVNLWGPEKEVVAPQKQNSDTRPITTSKYFMITQQVIQKAYKNDSESKGIGTPEVDCSFAEHWENDVDGLVYVKGIFSLAGIDAIKHTYNARYGSGTEELTYLVIDGKKIFYDDKKESYFMDKFLKNK